MRANDRPPGGMAPFRASSDFQGNRGTFLERAPAVALVTLAALAACGPDGGRPALPPDGSPARPTTTIPPDEVRLTWLSVTGWLLEAGETSVILDGYVSRVDRASLRADGTSTARAVTDSAAVDAIRDRLLPGGGPDWVLVGHGHWDHALDAPFWARRGGGRLAGSGTVCLQARALGLPAARCITLAGGEVLELGSGVTARAVRWHHSGSRESLQGRRLRAPLELTAVPETGPAGGLRPGTLEDYPAGAPFAYLIRFETDDGPIRIFWSNSGNPEAWDSVIPRDTAAFERAPPTAHLRWNVASAPTREALAAALEAEATSGVDLWLGFGNTRHAGQVIPMLRPRVMIPHHWDDFWEPIDDGPGRSFPEDGSLARLLASSGVELLPPAAYFERFLVGVRGVEREPE